MNSHAEKLRELLDNEQPVIAPGAFCPLVGRLVAEAGFPAVYLSGAAVSGGLYGQPDVGLATMTELVDAARRTVEVSGLPVVCDADTGFGGVLNVRRTIRDLEAAGVAAIHIEDQTFPRQCGFLGGHELASIREMISRLKAAVDARRSDATMIIARTEMFGSANLDETIERATRYLEAGADMIFCNGVTSVDQAETLAARIEGPQVYNVSTSGMTPHLNFETLARLGYKLVIFPAHTLFLALRQVADMLADLQKNGTIEPWLDQMIGFEEWKRLTGIVEAEATERKFGK